MSLIALLTISSIFAQEKTTVTATNSDISDNLDLRAVATIFGDASNLEDFERRLNDPKTQISNLDLNNDNNVDYLRVIESIEGNAHLVVVQAVLGKDVFQDVATIEVERDSNNRVQVQVVGDVYMYGTNYIYEPVYVHTPVIYTTFWVGNYRPYYSSWYWNYYPTYYSYWNPFPIFRYRNHIHGHINFGHSYHYTSNRRCHTAYNSYYGRRGNGYEISHPNRSFANRNAGYTNRRELDNTRTDRSPRTRNEMTSNQTRNTSERTRTNRESSQYNETTPRTRTESSTPRNNGTRGNPSPRVASESSTRNQGSRVNSMKERSNVTTNRSNSSRKNITSKPNTSRSATSSKESPNRSSSGSRSSSSRNSGRG